MIIHPITEVVCALIIKDDCVLIAQRGPTKQQAGKWEFPGGKRNANETPETALIREIKEELSIDIIITGALTVVHYGYAGYTIKLFPFLCTSENEPTLTEHSAYAKVAK
ncbi:MAG: (deoxy)nucleoside triphosphate pyrophosphohydrolase, partial [Flavobacteriales bacterium]